MTRIHIPDCVFCPANGKVRVITDTPSAYLTQPLNDAFGRYLIIPKDHLTELVSRPASWIRHENTLLEAAFAQAEESTDMNRSELDNALNLSWNQGEFAGQTIEHIHLWVIFRTDSLKIGLSSLIDKVEGLMEEVSEQELEHDRLLQARSRS